MPPTHPTVPWRILSRHQPVPRPQLRPQSKPRSSCVSRPLALRRCWQTVSLSPHPRRGAPARRPRGVAFRALL